MLLGGVCAAAIGFVAAYYVLPQLGLMTPYSGATSDVDTRLDDQAQRIETLAQQVTDMPAASEAPDLSGLEEGQRTLDGLLADLSGQITDLSARVDEIEQQPATGSAGASDSQVRSLRAALDEQGAQLDALTRETAQRENAARGAAEQALRLAALTRIRTALDTGSGFAPALGDLERAGMASPDALQEVAETGVPTQSALQEGFAPAARDALAAARKDGEVEGDPGFWSFLSYQFGARSLERREGPGTDAILSRAEDDLSQGKLQSALDEIDALPEPARAAMSGWAADARTRMQALAAHDALAAKLN